jgi:1-deoxy-D-xylulose-5-phosphate synthase
MSVDLVEMAASHKLVVTVEDGGRHGGFGSSLAAALRDADVEVPLRDIALPQRFHDHGDRGEVLALCGITAQDVARRVTERAARLECLPVEIDAPAEK